LSARNNVKSGRFPKNMDSECFRIVRDQIEAKVKTAIADLRT
jgi:hypothetical protein